MPPSSSTQSSRLTLIVPHSRDLLLLHTLVSDHPRILPDILTLNLQARLGLHSLEEEVIVAVWAVLVALLESLDVLAEALLALFAREDHLCRAHQIMVGFLGVAFGAVEPLPAAGGADGDLCVEDVFAEIGLVM